ncbi:MAG: UDP-N-acetylmuramoyl-tripeptide--D-alanyl-D-alanine ligase [Sphingomonas sp.]|uniref:UDP-N-acetylmuramoyl-tripeptide--D-alanyl-D- alanine ligase n=1 Tax=Sphingomonas sp. TaxID=28214 RepID=UPI0025E200AD|nr:UDP-N-acetylmuramoyl-tripeptide--D-alanyl-D-alanine ligase [Sphingomonas sp.]MBY0284252.1 UDP-N-acetylmuramoyl-tripeptide--D-alanyl-D-alanine ligase [Sphingomonas sp.]
MSLWTAADIAAASGGTASGDFVVDGVAFDSREVGPGDLFVALRGATTDGHNYLDQVFSRGAGGAIVSTPPANPASPHVLVPDTMAALEALAHASRARMHGSVTGVTGSVGKTGTKEMLFACLDRGAPGTVHRSVKSYNNHTGVPLSVARMPAASRYGVFEMGMNHAGEISALTRIVRPHVAIITTVASVHIEYFKDEAGIADAKAEIFEGLAPDGTAIIPYDNIHRDRLIAAALAVGARIVTFGLGEGADVRALETMRTTSGTFVTARLLGRELGFTIGQPGAHLVSNALAVLAAVEAVGADVAIAGLALADMGGLAGRGARVSVPTADGGKALVIDESYNANPTSMRATLDVLGAEPAARRIAVLGQMGELGADSAAFHTGLAGPILAAAVAYAILVGEDMRPLANALEGRLEFVHVPDASAARAALIALLADGDAVLVKGSNSVGLSAVVAALSDGKG